MRYFFINKNMKFLSSIFLLTSLLLGCLSCNSENGEVGESDIYFVDIESKVGESRSVYLSEIADSVYYIPLETTQESVVSSPFRYIMVYENKKLFYRQGESYKIFDALGGEFLGTFDRQGNGPEEYIASVRFLVNPEADILSVVSYNSLMEYDISGNFIRSVEFPDADSLKGIHYFNFGKIGDEYYVLGTSIGKRSDLRYSSLILDSASNIMITTGYPEKEKEFVKRVPLMSRISGMTPALIKYKDEVRVINGYDEYIIGVNKNLQVDTVYKLNLGRYKLSDPEKADESLHRFSTVFESSSYLFMQLRTGTLPFAKREFVNASGKIASASLACSYFDKSTGEFSFIAPAGIGQFGFIDDIEGGPAVWPLYVSSDDYMVSYVDAVTFIEHARTHDVSENFRKVAEGLDETDNPVLVLVKLKSLR